MNPMRPAIAEFHGPVRAGVSTLHRSESSDEIPYAPGVLVGRLAASLLPVPDSARIDPDQAASRTWDSPWTRRYALSFSAKLPSVPKGT